MNKQIAGILVNDVHLDKDNGELVKDIFHQLVNLCVERKTKTIFCGGDVFTNRSGQPLSTLTDFKEILRMIGDKGITLHVIPGNHDKTDGNSEASYLDVYSEKCVKVYRNATWLSPAIGLNVLFIPYFKDEKWLDEFNGCNSWRDKTDKHIIITHSGFDGVMNNDGSEVESEIKPSLFKKYDKVLIGHYHNASTLSKNVIYTGSAYQNNYGENITDKGFTIVYNDSSLEFIPSEFPRYIKEVIDVNDQESLRNLMEKYEGETYNHIRFLFKGKKSDCQKINIGELAKLGIDAKFESTETAEAIEISESEGVLNYDKKTLSKDFLLFCKAQEIKGEKLKYGMELIKSIKNVES